jgi:hypothetical protein
MRDERLDHRDQPSRRQVRHRVRAGLQRGRRRQVVGIDAQEHLAAVEPHPRDGHSVVAGEPVVDLEDRVGQAAAVHRADHDLAVQRAEQQQVLKHVRGPEHAVDPGPGQRHAEPLEQAGAIGHGGHQPPGPQCPACRVVGGDEHQRATGAQERRRARPPGRRLRHHLGSAGPGFHDLGEPVSEHRWPPDGSRSWTGPVLLLVGLLIPAHLVADLAAQPPFHRLRFGLQVAAQRRQPRLDP